MAASSIVLNANDYFTGLTNFILFMRLYATNTSKKEKSLTDVFCTETLEYGDQKVFTFAELPSVEDYSLTSSLLTDKPIKYAQEVIGNPIKKKISLSRVEPFLKMAMMNSGGMATFVAYILGLMESAKEDYLYNEIMKDLLKWSPSQTTGKEMNQTVPLLTEAGVTDAEALNATQLQNQKRIEKQWQKIFDDFSLYTDVFIDINNGGSSATNFKTAMDLKDLIFIGNAKFLNDEIMDLMAVLLNSDKIDKNFRRPYCIKIPQRTFDSNSASNVIGFVAHKHWYQWFYHFIYQGAFFDIDTVRIKNVLHFWYSKGHLKNLPVAKLTASYAGAGG